MLKISRVEFFIMVFETFNIGWTSHIEKCHYILLYLYICIVHVLDARHLYARKNTNPWKEYVLHNFYCQIMECEVFE